MGVESESGNKVKRIVSNTGPILHLAEAGILELLQKAGSVSIPGAVHVELSNLLRPAWDRQKPAWLHVEKLTEEEINQARSFSLAGLLDYAEAEAVLLAKRLNSDWFITDDTAARILSSSSGLEVHGSLGIVLWSAAVGHLDYDGASSALEKLSHTSLWISKNIMSDAHGALKKMFEAK
ncbi:MAG: hypothetical protein M0R70_07125 [Nitrospirae bacterium]|nr:hypothetical protein [Nitrospirota bacterium]